MSELEELEEELVSLRERVFGLREEKRNDENQALLGKCFRFRNSYSCPESDSYKWWLYKRILRAEDGCLFGLSFETDTNGRTEITANEYISIHGEEEEITLTEFMQAWADCKNQILALHPDELPESSHD